MNGVSLKTLLYFFDKKNNKKIYFKYVSYSIWQKKKHKKKTIYFLGKIFF